MTIPIPLRSMAAWMLLLPLLVACSHPLEIVGDGDILSSTGQNDCLLEDQPCDNYVVGDYDVLFAAEPREGWRFIGWEGCGSQFPICSINVPAAIVKEFWGEVAPPLRAEFHLWPTLAEAANQANLEVGAAVGSTFFSSNDVQLNAASQYTSITAENAMKWASLAPTPNTYNFNQADQLVNFANANGQRVRGHTLFWHRLNGPPSWLQAELAAANDPAMHLEQLMAAHTSAVVSRYAGQIEQWDVINEPFATFTGDFDTDSIFYQYLGEEFIEIALLQAHATDPSAALFINETGVVYLPRKFDALLALAQNLLDEGAPLHGIGIQGHYLFLKPNKAVLVDMLQRVGALGLKVEITELDIPLPLFSDEPDPLAAQAQSYADVFSACLEVIACTGITMWGINDSDTWLDSFEFTVANAPNRPLLFDESLQPKPAFYSVLEILLAEDSL
ncbi:MAG: endo-1,4-beta-xylanase [Halioglobus sp.]|nr:endo-1,4-beta-xylanase [Halioglobus sp.]